MDVVDVRSKPSANPDFAVKICGAWDHGPHGRDHRHRAARAAAHRRPLRRRPKDLRLQALLEYSRKVPPLPQELAGHRELMEQVPECQTPFFLATEVDDDDRVALHFDVPAEAPTTRGFAGILHSGLDGATRRRGPGHARRLLHEDGPGRGHLVQRLRGMAAILARLKRQVAAHVAAEGPAPA